jgi:hypothetical protein
MNSFQLYLSLGIDHISDLAGYDHILFLIALCAVYSLKKWARVAMLVTAFTVGHSLTLALATLNLLRVSTDWIEFLIPLTILATALWNVVRQRNANDSRASHGFKYMMALFFGLIHGLGFSNYLRSLLGGEASLFVPLLGFNVGLELGQIMIVLLILLLSFLVVQVLSMGRRDWNLLMSGAAMGVSIVLCLERWPL